MENKITNRQIFFIIVVTLTSYSIVDIARALATSSGYGSWLTIIIATLFFAIVAIIITKLQTVFQNQVIFNYSEKLVGTVGRYILAIYYIAYFSMILIFLNLQLSSILKADFIPKTPIVGTLLFGMPVFCFLAYKGITTVARLFEIIGVILLVVGTTVHVLMLTQGNINYILPLFNKQDIGIYLRALKVMIFPFLGLEVLLHIPFSNKNGRKSITTSALTVLVVGLFFFLVTYSCIMKLGMNDIVHYNSSIVVAIRDMELPFLDFLKRLDVMFLTVGLSAFAMGVTIIFVIIIDLLSNFLPKFKRSIITVIVGVLFFVACLIFNTIDWFNWFVLDIGLYLGLVASVAIPTILLIIAKVKKYA